jgi:dihydrofolate reductase
VTAPVLTLIAARGANGCIGIRGALPWRMPSDLKRFKATTLGKPVLMGRKTWDSIGKPLPGRDNLVWSRDAGFRPGGAWVFASLDALIAAGRAMAQAKGEEDVCVIGGAALYEATLPIADRLILTEVALSPEGDAFFPQFDEKLWTEASREALDTSDRDDAPAMVRVLERRR